MDVEHNGIWWRRDESDYIWWWDGRKWIAWNRDDPQHPPPPPHIFQQVAAASKPVKGRGCLIILLIVAGVVILGAILGALGLNDFEAPTTTDEKHRDTLDRTPASKAEFKSRVVNYFVENPAALRVVVRTENVGNAPAIPECEINARDSSYTYTGFDIYILRGDRLDPGEHLNWNAVVTIDEEGAVFVTQVRVKCTPKGSF